MCVLTAYIIHWMYVVFGFPCLKEQLIYFIAFMDGFIILNYPLFLYAYFIAP